MAPLLQTFVCSRVEQLLSISDPSFWPQARTSKISIILIQRRSLDRVLSLEKAPQKIVFYEMNLSSSKPQRRDLLGTLEQCPIPIL